MGDREALEKFAVGVRADRDNAEAVATHAQESLSRQACGIVKLEDLNPDEIRAAADDLASAVEKLKIWEEVARRVRHILM